jgi:hypothetical protein
MVRWTVQIEYLLGICQHNTTLLIFLVLRYLIHIVVMSENMKAEVFSEEDELVSEEERTELVGNSSNSLCEALHGGRPADEEPHIKKTMKRSGVKKDLILRVDLVRAWTLWIYT